MKTILLRTSLVGLLAASGFYAQNVSSLDGSAMPARYKVTDLGTTDLGTFGGTFNIAYGINNAGLVGGGAALPNGNVHPFLSGAGGAKKDLGTLGGPNASASAPNGRGDAPIVSELSTPDPLKEDFCGFGSHLICLGALWNGVMTPLPTLGGNNAMALFMNNRGEIVGVAENAKHDPSCPSPQVLDYEAVVWGPKQGQIQGPPQGLPPLSGDTVGFALGINERGQVVGSSGSCANTVVTAVGLFVGPHAVLWENGLATNLGNLGGNKMGKAGAINNRGEVAGFSDLPDGSIHSFLWTRETGMHDLGALGTDLLGDPAGINNNTQVVGGSCVDIHSQDCRAFLWEKNVMSDLNDLAPDSPLFLAYALGINDAGEIVGFGVETSTGDVHAYLATPINGKSGKQSVAPFQKRLPFGRLGDRQPGRR